jgi:argininosuccinate lyase
VGANSIDISSDRDFVLEFVFCLTLIAEHLSGWAEEWILWSTSEFDFLKLPQAFCTGSSIMPQKVNPDVLELIRGKTARVIGSLTSLLVLVKGLPQEDKVPLFDAFDTVSACLAVAAPLVRGAELNRPAILEKLDRGHLDATTFMEYLIRRGIPQRTAHAVVGRLVRRAIDRGLRLEDLTLAEFQEAVPGLNAEVYGVLGVQNALAAFVSYGSTGPEQVADQILAWRQKLAIAPQPGQQVATP